MTDETDTDRTYEARIAQLIRLDRLAQSFGRSLTTALTGSIASGRSLDGVLTTIGTRLMGVAAQAAKGPLRAGVKGPAQRPRPGRFGRRRRGLRPGRCLPGRAGDAFASGGAS